jgi:hypothetical protein
MESPQTAAARLADALLVASIVVHGTLSADTPPEVLLARMRDAFTDLTARYGTADVDRAAELVEVAFELLCSEIFIEP